MHLKRYDVVDVGEYKILIDYAGSEDGSLDVTVLDELGDEIEGIYISNAPDVVIENQVSLN